MERDTVRIDDKALCVAIEFIRSEIQLAVEKRDYDAAVEWDVIEGSMMVAKAVGGYLERTPKIDTAA